MVHGTVHGTLVPGTRRYETHRFIRVTLFF